MAHRWIPKIPGSGRRIDEEGGITHIQLRVLLRIAYPPQQGPCYPVQYHTRHMEPRRQETSYNFVEDGLQTSHLISQSKADFGVALRGWEAEVYGEAGWRLWIVSHC
jgi:hypothetical protein